MGEGIGCSGCCCGGCGGCGCCGCGCCCCGCCGSCSCCGGCCSSCGGCSSGGGSCCSYFKAVIQVIQADSLHFRPTRSIRVGNSTYQVHLVSRKDILSSCWNCPHHVAINISRLGSCSSTTISRNNCR